MRPIPFMLVIVAGLLAACQTPDIDTSNAIKFKLSSPAFTDSGPIPQKYTCQGDNLSPELDWNGAPANTRSFALILEDPDAPGGTFTHWVLFDILADQKQLPEGAGLNRAGGPNNTGRSIGVGGNNSQGQTGYTGPCPPSGSHRYYFRLYALDIPSLNLKEGASRGDVETAMKDHVIGTADTLGRYEKQ